jgi:hypothetical protein
MWWGTLFRHRGDVYLLGTSSRFGSIVIRRSRDGGYTWTVPTDETSGLLFEGGEGETPPNYHCAPVPVTEIDGRLYRAFENNDPRDWPRGFKSTVVSCDTAADLLDADNWRMSNQLPFPADDAPSSWGEQDDQGAGWLEGNVVNGPGGEVWNVLRVNSQPVVDEAAIVRVRDRGREVAFEEFVTLPGGMTKFEIRRDPETDLYWMLANPNTEPAHANQRNVLAVFASEDCRDWQHARTLMYDDLSSGDESLENTGFQYPTFRYDGPDLLYLSRTAYDGAANYHDSNRITFDVVREFRELTPRELF